MNLRIPGPIPVPEDILQAMSKPMINHRGPKFKDILHQTTDHLKQVFQTEGDLLILTSSGTGAMEAAVTNTLSPGDKVICASIGSFGDRFGKIARSFGANVSMLNFSPGTAINPGTLRNALKANEDVKAVLVTHNETNTGVTNDLESIARIVKGEFNKLLLVDGISSVCSIPLKSDEWGCDVVVSASQKGWMLPPGLAFISFSKRAWEAYSTSSMPKFYFDLAQYKQMYDIGQPPFTPSISIMFALELSLKKILEEGMSSIYLRHQTTGKVIRDRIRSIGLSVFPEESIASNTVTAVKVPKNVVADELIKTLEKEHQVTIANGYGSLKGKIFRIGHLGYVSQSEIDGVFNALIKTIPK